MIPNKPTVASETLACPSAFKRRILRLSSWTVHNANHLCPSPGWLKGGGGYRALRAPVAALHFDVLGP